MASQVPEYDEVSDEDFRGPFGPDQVDGFDEAWDDDYEAQAAALFNDGVLEPPPEHLASPGVGSDFTHLEVERGLLTRTIPMMKIQIVEAMVTVSSMDITLRAETIRKTW